jgi:hypothetical protein
MPDGARWARRLAMVLAVVVTAVAQVVCVGTLTLAAEFAGTPRAEARGTGHDAEWLGHAWVDGRKTMSDVDRLAEQLIQTGIRDLFVHAGPFSDDGSLDPALRPQARWLIRAIHTTMPGIRVQAWLGAHPVPGQLDLASPQTRARVLEASGQVLDDGFDGIHYDFEPLVDGNEDLLSMLRQAHEMTRQRHVVLSVSATRSEPWPGVGAALARLGLPLWSAPYLHQVASSVDQVAIMAYDSGLIDEASYGGYVRRTTQSALREVPAGVELLIGVPVYDDRTLYHHPSVETLRAALRGVRLALATTTRKVGVALYVDFTVTPDDWTTYRREWTDPGS